MLWFTTIFATLVALTSANSESEMIEKLKGEFESSSNELTRLIPKCEEKFNVTSTYHFSPLGFVGKVDEVDGEDPKESTKLDRLRDFKECVKEYAAVKFYDSKERFERVPTMEDIRESWDLTAGFVVRQHLSLEKM